MSVTIREKTFHKGLLVDLRNRKNLSMSRVKKSFPYYKIYSYNLTEIRQKETSRAMERFFPSRVIKMQYKLQNKFKFYFLFIF